MGYELDRLMKMYGVGTPSMPSYSGASKPSDFADPNYATKLANYEADKAAYDKFQQDYQGRIAGVSPYSMPQFQTAANPATVTPPQLLKAPIYTNNPEYYKPMVEQAYTSDLNRPFDIAGRDYWASQLAKGTIMPTALGSSMLAAQNAPTTTNTSGGPLTPTTSGTSGGPLTPTVTGTAGVTAPQVEALYQSVLGRTADTPGLQYWLGSGLSLPEIEANLRASAEYGNRSPLADVSTDYYSNGGAVRGYAQGGRIQPLPVISGVPSRGGAPKVSGGLNTVKQMRDPRNVDPRNPRNKPLPGTNTYTPPVVQPPIDDGYGDDMRYPDQPQQPLVGGNPLNPGPLVGANPLTPPTTGGDYPLPPPVTGGDYPMTPTIGGDYPLPDQQSMFGDSGLSTQMPTQQFVGGLGGRQISPYAVDYSPRQQAVAPAAYAAGGQVKMSRGGLRPDPVEEEGGLLTLADIYGLSNPGELPMIEAPVQLAALNTGASDAEGFPVGNTADIVAAGRAAVAQAQANARAGVQPDPAVYDDAAAAREGAPPAAAARSAPAVSRPSLDDLMKKYGAGQSQYVEQIRAASEKSRAETEAFREMLKKQMTGETEGGPSKAEMYFRLAAALAAPTKTGGIMENVGLAAKELGDYQKDVTASRRQNRARNLELMLKGQELSMRSAKEELDSLRALSAEEGRDRRQIAGEMIKEYIRSGEPESAAGKQAKDEGLVPGTPEYVKRVQELAQTNVDARLAQVTATIEGMRRQDERAKLDREKFEAQQKEKAEASAKLTPKEIDMKAEAEDVVAQADQALENMRQAYALNPNTFDTSLGDVVRRKILENTVSDDPKVVATRQLENLLGRGALEKLRATFGGSPTEGERKILLDLEGIGAKSREERKEILLSAYEALKKRRDREAKRLEDIKSGKYREREPAKKDGEE